MNVWCHLPTIFRQRRILQIVGFITLTVALITTLFFGISASAQQGINKTINFQGRLLDASKNPVPDGNYNIQFRIYEGGTGTTKNNGGTEPVWMETYTNNGGAVGVPVRNGYLSVDLGSKTPFGDLVDWNDDTLWLSMNIAGAALACTTFGQSPCVADGEMLPMKRLTATPYAMNAGKLGGIDASGFIQNRTDQQTGNFNISGIGIADVLRGMSGVISNSFDRADAGTLSIGSGNATAIEIGSATSDQTISIGTGTGNTTVAIGSSSGTSSVSIQSGDGGLTLESNGGTISLNTGGDDQLVIDNAGIISTHQDSQLIVNGTALFNKGIDLTGGYSIDGINTLNKSALTFSGTGTSTVAAATGEALSVSSSTNVSVDINGSSKFSVDSASVQIGDGIGGSEPTLLTLDRAAGAPAATGNALLGSMYYDTTLGTFQCYEASGWGDCNASPDAFVTLSPEYANAVTNGSTDGTFTSDFCSGTLGINDGSDEQPAVCSATETNNYYSWKSDKLTDQTKNIYVTYQLSSNFDNFIEDSVTLGGKTTSNDASVKYQLYRNTDGTLTPCGGEVSVSTGAQANWKNGVANGGANPASCNFAAGDSIVIKISLTSKNNAVAYAGTLNFAFSTKH